MANSLVYKTCGAIGILGSIAVVAADFIGIAVHEAHDPISNTISMLAIGKYGWIQDWGLNILALGYLAIAIGLLTFKAKGTKWLTSIFMLILLGVTVVLIAEHNQYAGRPGENMHKTLVYIMAGLFLVMSFLISFDISNLHPSLKKLSRWVAALWLIFAPLLPLIPDAWDGAYERLICVLLVIWPLCVSYRLITATPQ